MFIHYFSPKIDKFINKESFIHEYIRLKERKYHPEVWIKSLETYTKYPEVMLKSPRIMSDYLNSAKDEIRWELNDLESQICWLEHAGIDYTPYEAIEKEYKNSIEKIDTLLKRYSNVLRQ